MIELFKGFSERRAAKNFMRSPVGEALRKHTQEYLYTTSNLRHLSEEKKNQIVEEFLAHASEVFNSANPLLKLREELANVTYNFAYMQVLCLTEKEKADAFYGESPYVSGTLYHRVLECAPHNEDLKYFVWKHPEVPAEDLVSFANLRCCQFLYCLNGFNILRSELKDMPSHSRDWLRPFTVSMLIWAENTYREKISMPILLRGSLDALKHSTFMNIVVNGEADPLYDWETHYNLSHPAFVSGAEKPPETRTDSPN